MATFQEIQNELAGTSTVSIAIGNFDGVHLGHQAIIQELKEAAYDNQSIPVVLVLYPHPIELFTGSSPALLTTLQNRISLIQSFGVEKVFGLDFDRALSQWSVEEFLRFLIQKLQMKCLVIGPTTHVGKNRSGTPDRLQQLASDMGFKVSIVDHKKVMGSKISSSVIRDAVSRGDVRHVAGMLGRYYQTEGIVETGMGKGTGLGFPTANLARVQTLVPARGVYAGYVWFEGRRYKAAINVGTRPTVTDSLEMVIEPHLLDFNEKIVGRTISIDWVERLRNEIKFKNVEELKIQIQTDVRKTRDII